MSEGKSEDFSDLKASFQCLCKSVTYEISGPPAMAVNCHCESCRVFGGAPACVGCWKPEQFKLTKGKDCVLSYESAPKKFRDSCKKCGTWTNNILPNGLYVIPLGGLKYPKGGCKRVEPTMHIFYAERVADAPDSLKKHDGWPA
mmetsp:Transcript_22509/g.31505  ORF Transcript_22509/g.31505 Transcript_22509/m.31505 type:complete len:144 (+) Transcript_22509:193-624(+)|eukprot:CAMPEP_0185251206 /NCGR_PEP_ID=MMETSP1359-20130426/646_1 /TAXON_ID=552665 /ORGANISM="Bigelowiella longifila, Strain CCMP242" /LENGTH=143 /DNA_ID=CAMNT_0027833003 /DNA_START=215 /DNA_END=646 /DNA_ORIENTATION=+